MLIPERSNKFPSFFHFSYFKVAILMEEALPFASSVNPCFKLDIPGTGSTQEPSIVTSLQATKVVMARTTVKFLNISIFVIL